MQSPLDLLRSKSGAGLSAGALALLLTGCGGWAGVEQSNSETPQQEPSKPESFTVEHTYTDDGKRITDYRIGETRIGDATYAYCDGPDLVEFPQGRFDDTSVITRSVGAAACKDGRLDPADFKLPASR